MSVLMKTIAESAKDFGSIPFWSWNDRLEESELRRQIRQMKDLGMGGFFMHARGGLETEYLSDEWFDAVRACVDEAKKLGMEAWSYDENGWPSGFAGGKLLHDKKNFALGLLWEDVKEFPTDEDTVAAYLRNADGSFTHVTAPVDGAEGYLRLYKLYDESYVDVLDADITKQFLELTHAVYQKKLDKEDFGASMPGFFTDEPQYFRWGRTYSNLLPDLYEKTYGESIYPGLPAIYFDFDGADSFRYNYYKLLHETFINNWVKVVYEWCHEHGVRLTGHAVEETTLEGQMMCIGGVMPFYEYEDIPGMDYLGRGFKNDIAQKQLGSAAAQLGKKKVLTETFACCGWDVSPTELKRIADLQYAGGVNLMCQHLFPYSERGQRKRDYPLHYSDHSPWQSDFGDFCRYYAALGGALSQGEEVAPVLVIHPIHGAYMKYKKGEGSLREIDGHFRDLSNLLGEYQIPYHWGDENLMKRYASLEGDRIRVGNCVYSAVILPFTYQLDRETAEMLKQYLAAGGKLWMYKDAPACIDGKPADTSFLRATISFDDLLAMRSAALTRADGSNAPAQTRPNGTTAPAIRYCERHLPDGSALLFLANSSAETLEDMKLTVKGRAAAAEIDLMSGELRPVFGKVTEDGCEIALRFDDAESHLLLVGGEEALPLMSGKPSAAPSISLPDRAALAVRPENILTLDTAQLSKDGVHWDEPLSIYGIKDNLLRERFDGRIWLRYTFNVAPDCKPETLRLILEPMGMDSVFVNGSIVRPDREHGWFDRSFVGAEIAPYLHEGVNEAVVSLKHRQRPYVYYVLYGGVSESLRNCLVFDTEIEAAYLVGDFAVRSDAPFTPGARSSEICDGPFVLTAQKGDVSLRDAVSDGYAFFGGALTVNIPLLWRKGDPTVLSLTGRYATANIAVNGKPAGTMLFNRSLDLAGFLTDGENRITITYKCAMRNTMGPHHRSDPEPYSVGPHTYSFEKEWNGRACGDYLDRYAFVRFGIR